LKRLAGTWEYKAWRYRDAMSGEVVIRTQKIEIDTEGGIRLLADDTPDENFKIGELRANQIRWVGGATLWLYENDVASISPDFNMFVGVGGVAGARISGKRIAAN
jgi:hypothetical protein